MANTTANLSETGAIDKGTGPLMWARLGSLVSILPLGVWVTIHLWNNLAAFRGAEPWQRAVTEYKHPYATAFTLVLVFLPLLIHTVWGIQRMFSFRPNNGAYPFFGNMKYALQRLAAVGTLGFVIAHVWLAFLRPRLLQGHPEQFADIAREMHFHAPTLIVYLLGTLGVSYHLANGLSGFAWQWGLVSGRRSLQRFDLFAIIVFVILAAMSWGAIYALYNAGQAFPPS
jgi:succinate dehydrogenase / fumarate reductase, cytochrome b subunit